jgi:hypothetical protein
MFVCTLTLYQGSKYTQSSDRVIAVDGVLGAQADAAGAFDTLFLGLGWSRC